MTMGMALSGFHDHRRLIRMVRRDGDLGGRQGRLPRISEELFPMSPEKSYRYFWSPTLLQKKFNKNFKKSWENSVFYICPIYSVF
jgi:hypothetical protein